MPSDLCREFERRSRQTPDLDQLLACPDLSRHAAECEFCARQLRDTRHLQVALPGWRAEVPAVDLTDAVLARWQDERSTVSRAPVSTAGVTRLAPVPAETTCGTSPGGYAASGGSRGGVLVTAVLTLLLSALVIAPGRQVPENSTAEAPESPVGAATGTHAAHAGSTVSPDSPTPPAAGIPREVPLDRLVWNVGSAWTGLTTAAVGEVTVSALSAAGSPTDDPQRPETSPLSLLDETIGPMQQDLTEAVYFLMDVLPTGSGSRT